MLFQLAGTEYPVTVAVNQNANEFLRMIGALAQGAILRFNTARIGLLKKIMKQVAIMLRRQKVKDVAWKQLTLDSINRVGFEGTGHMQ